MTQTSLVGWGEPYYGDQDPPRPAAPVTADWGAKIYEVLVELRDEMRASRSPATKPKRFGGRAGIDAQAWLKGVLVSAGATGLTWRDIAAMGRGAGHSEVTLRRVRDTVATHRIVTRGPAGKSTRWYLKADR